MATTDTTGKSPTTKTTTKTTSQTTSQSDSRAPKAPATPLYALAGAGDLAIEKLREVREDLATRLAALKDKDVPAELTRRQTEIAQALTKRQAAVAEGLSKGFETLAADAKTVPAQLRELPALMQTTVTTVVDQAESTYDELAGRGKDVVTRIRHQQASQDLAAKAKTTVSKAKATRTSAARAAAETGDAADNAGRNAKATVTSARKTGKAAARAAGDAASKIGN